MAQAVSNRSLTSHWDEKSVVKGQYPSSNGILMIWIQSGCIAHVKFIKSTYLFRTLAKWVYKCQETLVSSYHGSSLNDCRLLTECHVLSSDNLNLLCTEYI